MNMFDKLLSIVIPSYNMEKYLPRCLDSLCQPSILDKLELIIVNDGSKDQTLSIAQNYKEIYPNTIVVVDKENGNYGSCVNRGLDIAKGKFFRILDADDMVNSESLIIFISELEKSNADLIITNYTRENLFKNKIQKISTQGKSIDYSHVYHIEDIDIFHLAIQDNFVMHAMTYNTEILKKKPLRHQEGISYTDTEYCYYPIDNVKTIQFLDIYLYRYQLGRDGQTMSKESFMKNRNHLFLILHRMLESDTNGQKIKEEDNRQKIKDSVILTTAKFYYYILLCHVGYNVEDDKKLELIDQSLKKNPFIYNILNQYKAMSVLSIVKKYRNSHKYSDGFPFRQMYSLSNLIKF